MKRQNGITLIALVITIIVLLILAGVSISAVMGENGIATKAKESKEKTDDASYLEEVELLLSEHAMEMETDDTITSSIPDSFTFEGWGENDDGEGYTVYSYKDRLVKVYFSDNDEVIDVELAEESDIEDEGEEGEPEAPA